jgi:hypothetical protein
MRQAGVSGFVRKEDSDELLYELELRTMSGSTDSRDGPNHRRPAGGSEVAK